MTRTCVKADFFAFSIRAGMGSRRSSFIEGASFFFFFLFIEGASSIFLFA